MKIPRTNVPGCLSVQEAAAMIGLVISGRYGRVKAAARMLLLKRFKRLVEATGGLLKEGFTALVLCALADIVAGISLVGFKEVYTSFPGLLIIIPGALATRGNVYATLASRLGTALHLGEISPTLRMNRPLRENLLASLVQTLFLSFALAIFARGASLLLGLPSVSLSTLLFISILGSLIAASILIVASTAVAIGSFRRGWDPDNVSAPLITALGDIVTLPSIALAAYIVHYVGRGTGEVGGIILGVMSALIPVLAIRWGGRIQEILRGSLHVLLLCTLISIFTGLLLSTHMDSMIAYSLFVLIIPVFNEEGGNLGSILSARLSTAYYLGITSLKRRIDQYSLKIMGGVMLLALIIFPLMGAIGLSLTSIIALTHPGALKTLGIITLAGIVVGAESIIVGYYLSHLSVRLSLNPDNVVIPLLTSFMDVGGLSTLILLMMLFGLI